MKFEAIPHRNFLFLQGPPGPFFWQLSQQLRAQGFGIFRINVNGGDHGDWPGVATHYRGTHKGWTLFIDRFLNDNAITDVVLFGDCRPLHMAAHQMAQLRKIAVHVFEEGYIRPNWLTLEPSGVNGNSSLSRDPAWYLEQALTLPPVPNRPQITASFKRRARDSYRYFSRTWLSRPFYPFYRSHRQGSVIIEGLCWLRKFVTEAGDTKRAAELSAALGETPYFLFPLQLSTDFQIRQHSPFLHMAEAVEYVLFSFARRAPATARLLIKEHPLDATVRPWRGRIATMARRAGVADRVLFVAGGDLPSLSAGAAGMVTVNSTSGTLALVEGTPTMALGKAIYNIPGLTHQGTLDDFWTRPQAPDAATYDAFRRVLHDRCLIYGGLASKSATRTLVESAMERLTGDKINRWASTRLKR